MKTLTIYISALLLLIVQGCSKIKENTILEMQPETIWEMKAITDNTWVPVPVPADFQFYQNTFNTIDFSSKYQFRAYFNIDNTLLSYENIDLELSISGDVAIILNDSLLFTGNMPDTPALFKIKKYLVSGKNTITVNYFKNILPANGIWSPIKLRGWNIAKINQVNLTLTSLNDKKAIYHVEIDIESTIDTDVNIDLWINNKKPVKLRDIIITNGHNKQTLSFSIPNPKLWWPNGLGTAHQNVFHTKLIVPNAISHVTSKPIEICKVENVADKNLNRNCIELNNHKIFIKGVVFNPPMGNSLDSTYNLFKQITKAAKDVNINYIYSPKSNFFGKEQFKKLCNENGILFLNTNGIDIIKPHLENINFNNEFIFKMPQPNEITNCAATPAILQTNTDSVWKYYPNNKTHLGYYTYLLYSEKIKSHIESKRIKNSTCGILFHSFNDTCLNISPRYFNFFGNQKPILSKLKDAYSIYQVIPMGKYNNNVDIFIVNDDIKELNAILLCRLIDLNGTDFFVKQIPVSIKAKTVTNAVTLLKNELFLKTRDDNKCLIVQLNQPGQTIAQNILFFNTPKNIKLLAVNLKPNINTTAKSFNLIFKSNVLVKNVVLSTTNPNTIFSDNNFDILPDKRTKISVNFPGTQKQLENELSIMYLNPGR